MIKSKLSLFMGREKHRMVDVAAHTGLNRSTISRLYNDEMTRIETDTLDRLCILYGCQPGDLFEFVVNPEEDPVLAVIENGRVIKEASPKKKESAKSNNNK